MIKSLPNESTKLNLYTFNEYCMTFLIWEISSINS